MRRLIIALIFIMLSNIIEIKTQQYSSTYKHVYSTVFNAFPTYVDGKDDIIFIKQILPHKDSIITTFRIDPTSENTDSISYKNTIFYRDTYLSNSFDKVSIIYTKDNYSNNYDFHSLKLVDKGNKIVYGNDKQLEDYYEINL